MFFTFEFLKILFSNFRSQATHLDDWQALTSWVKSRLTMFRRHNLPAFHLFLSVEKQYILRFLSQQIIRFWLFLLKYIFTNFHCCIVLNLFFWNQSLSHTHTHTPVYRYRYAFRYFEFHLLDIIVKMIDFS